MVNKLFDNYGNCTSFKLCNENEEFYKNSGQENDKDYRTMMMLNTPPSNAHKNSKYMNVQSTNNKIQGLFTYTPRDDKRLA
jgi:spore germination protein GerM